jgi:hypothetical protein
VCRYVRTKISSRREFDLMTTKLSKMTKKLGFCLELPTVARKARNRGFLMVT